MTTYSTDFDRDSAIRIGPIRSDDLHGAPGRWYVNLKAFSRVGQGPYLDPAEARAIAHQLLAVAVEVERLRKSEEP